MKIQCILPRKGGTRVEIDGIEYHFEPFADGAQVADIESEKHIDRFLSISEGYRLYRGASSPEVASEAESETAPGSTSEENRDELAAAYAAKFGKKPHYRAKLETIKAELEAA